MPKVSEDYLEARRRGILGAAQRCVSRRGIQGTTMRDICRAANLSPGAVYRYFQSKDEILGALSDFRQGQIQAFFRVLAKPMTADERAEAVANLLRSLDSEAALDGMRLDVSLWSQALQSPEVAETLTPGLDKTVHALESSLAGEWPVGTGRAIVALFQGLALHKALKPELDLSQMEGALQAFLPNRTD